MWVLTSFGAFMPALRPPETVPVGDDRVIQIRARRKIDLHRLRQNYMPDLGPTYTIRGSDYECRADCTRAALAAALTRISLDIDYVSFKDTTTEVWQDDQLHRAYLRVWAALQGALGDPRRHRKATKAKRGQQPLWGDPWGPQ